jgi:hypothetical protein
MILVSTTWLPKLYLDFDGPLLRRRHSEWLDAFELAADCLEFLEWSTTRFRCRWAVDKMQTRLTGRITSSRPCDSP